MCKCFNCKKAVTVEEEKLAYHNLFSKDDTLGNRVFDFYSLGWTYHSIPDDEDIEKYVKVKDDVDYNYTEIICNDCIAQVAKITDFQWEVIEEFWKARAIIFQQKLKDGDILDQFEGSEEQRRNINGFDLKGAK